MVDLQTGAIEFASLEAEEIMRISDECCVYGMTARFLLKDGLREVVLKGFERWSPESQSQPENAESPIGIRADLGQTDDLLEEAAGDRRKQMAAEFGTSQDLDLDTATQSSRPRMR